MQQVPPSLTHLFLILVLPLVLIAAASALRHRYPVSPWSGAALFFAAHSVTVALTYLAWRTLGLYVPVVLFPLLPLIFTALYLGLGYWLKNPFLWLLGVATPGLWYVCQHLFRALGHPLPFTVPQDPVWYLAASLALLVLARLPRFMSIRGEIEDGHLRAAAWYGALALALLGLGTPSVLAWFGLPLWTWIAGLALLGAFLLWAWRLMADPTLLAVAIISLVAALYAAVRYLTTMGVKA